MAIIPRLAGDGAMSSLSCSSVATLAAFLNAEMVNPFGLTVVIQSERGVSGTVEDPRWAA